MYVGSVSECDWKDTPCVSHFVTDLGVVLTILLIGSLIFSHFIFILHKIGSSSSSQNGIRTTHDWHAGNQKTRIASRLGS